MSPTESWQHWIQSHGRQLVLFARRWTRDASQAEDLVQEAFVRFWVSRSKASDPLAYLYQCVRRVAIDASRQQQSRVAREQMVAGVRPQESWFESPLEEQERRVEIERALEQLPEAQAEVVVLKIWSGLTLAQIAEVTGDPAGTVATRYRSALSRLRTVLGEAEVE